MAAAWLGSSADRNMRELRLTDAPAIATLIHSFGWQQTERDLRHLLSSNNVIAFGYFEESTSELLSLAALQSFDSTAEAGEIGFGFLSYVATTPHARRQGLASALVTSLLAFVPSSIPIALLGSPDGAPMYKAKFGFTDRGHGHLVSMGKEKLARIKIDYAGFRPFFGSAGGEKRMVLIPKLETLYDVSLLPAEEALDDLLELDRRVFGVDRRDALSKWVDAYPDSAWAVCDYAEGHILGYVVCRPMHPTGFFLGPMVCESMDHAECLLLAALAGLPDGVEEVHALMLDVWGAGEKAEEPSFDCEPDGVGRGNDAGLCREWKISGAVQHRQLIGGIALASAYEIGFVRISEEPSRLMVREGSSLALGEGSAAESSSSADAPASPSAASPHSRLAHSIAWIDAMPEAQAAGKARPFAAAGYEFG